MTGSHARRSPRLALISVVLLLPTLAACPDRDARLEPAELQAMVDSLLPEIARASGLPVLEPVRVGIQSPAEVRAFVEERLAEDMPPAEFEGMERAYRAFGLLPPELDLRGLLLDLYTEQVIGYYDTRTRRLVVVAGVRSDAAAPVVAHELVHALQDQHVDLDSLVARERGNDRQAAAQAAAEGQATLVMVALQAARAGDVAIDPADLPDMARLLAPAIEAEHDRFPVFRDAPRIIRETVTFPYLAGAAFVQALYRARAPDDPVPVPFGEWLPQSTRQVMSPDAAFIEERIHPVEIRLQEPPAGWRVAYENTLGQLEVGILLAEHLGDGARDAADGWAGDRYLLLDGPHADGALVWYSAWDDDDAADRFADACRRALDTRTDRVARVERMTVAGRAVVRVTDAPAGTEIEGVPVPAVRTLH